MGAKIFVTMACLAMPAACGSAGVEKSSRAGEAQSSGDAPACESYASRHTSAPDGQRCSLPDDATFETHFPTSPTSAWGGRVVALAAACGDITQGDITLSLDTFPDACTLRVQIDSPDDVLWQCAKSDGRLGCFRLGDVGQYLASYWDALASCVTVRLGHGDSADAADGLCRKLFQSCVQDAKSNGASNGDANRTCSDKTVAAADAQ